MRTVKILSMQDFDRDGWRLVPGVMTPAACDSLLAAITSAATGSGTTAEASGVDTRRRGGIRGLFSIPAVVALVHASEIRALIEPLIGQQARAVRATLFDKSEVANWRVPWHRDRLIAVNHRFEVSGFSAWSEKDGVMHVAPPHAYVQRMVALRLHLDAVDADNGPLQVISGSHLDPSEATDDVPYDPAHLHVVTCTVGSVMLMRPWLRHASGPALQPRHRRVLHVEFSADALPAPLEWHDSW